MSFFWLFVLAVNTVLHFMISDADIAQDDGKYVVAIMVISIALIIALANKYKKEKLFFIMLLGAYVLRILFMIWTTYFNDIFLLPNAGQDELTYYWNAYSSLFYNKWPTVSYDFLCALQVRFFGLSLLYLKFINVLLSMMTLCVISATLKKIKVSKLTYNLTTALACFLPNFALLSGLLLRESIISLLVAMSAYCFICWWFDGSRAAWYISIGFSLAGAWLHSGILTIAAAIAVLRFISAVKNGVRKLTFSTQTVVIASAASFVLLFLSVNTGIGDALGLTGYFRNADSVMDIMNITNNYVEGGAAYNANWVPGDNIFAFLINTPIHIFYFLFSPMPWDWRGLNDILTFMMSSIFYLWIVVTSIVCAFRRKEQSLLTAFLIISFLVSIVFGWGCSNAGTAMRHRDKLIAMYLIMFALVSEDLIKNPFKHKKRGNE